MEPAPKAQRVPPPDAALSVPAPPPARQLAPSTGGTAEPNDQPYGDVFFRGYGTNPFIDSEDDPLSTFGLDVDTGSWGVVRRYLRDGNLPPREAVRVEELVNAFDYGDPAPRRGDFRVVAEGAATPFAGRRDNPRYRVLRFGLHAREVDVSHRKPAVLTFVVDVSGSMSGGEPARPGEEGPRPAARPAPSGRPGGPGGLRLPRLRGALSHERPRGDPRRHRPAGARGLDQRRGGPGPRVRPRPPGLPAGRDQPGDPVLGRRRQRRPHRPRVDPRPDRRRRPRRHRADHRRLRHGQLQRRADGAARRPRRRHVRLRRRPGRGAAGVRREPHRHPPDHRPGRQGAGRGRPGGDRPLPAARLREPGRGGREVPRRHGRRRRDRGGPHGDGALRGQAPRRHRPAAGSEPDGGDAPPALAERGERRGGGAGPAGDRRRPGRELVARRRRRSGWPPWSPSWPRRSRGRTGPERPISTSSSGGRSRSRPTSPAGSTSPSW